MTVATAAVAVAAVTMPIPLTASFAGRSGCRGFRRTAAFTLTLAALTIPLILRIPAAALTLTVTLAALIGVALITVALDVPFAIRLRRPDRGVVHGRADGDRIGNKVFVIDFGGDRNRHADGQCTARHFGCRGNLEGVSI